MSDVADRSALRNSLARCHVPVYPLRMRYPCVPPLRLSSVSVVIDLDWWAGTFRVPGRQSQVDFPAPGSQGRE